MLASALIDPLLVLLLLVTSTQRKLFSDREDGGGLAGANSARWFGVYTRVRADVRRSRTDSLCSGVAFCAVEAARTHMLDPRRLSPFPGDLRRVLQAAESRMPSRLMSLRSVRGRKV